MCGPSVVLHTHSELAKQGSPRALSPRECFGGVTAATGTSIAGACPVEKVSLPIGGEGGGCNLGSELRRGISDFVVFTENFGDLGFRYSQYEKKYENPLAYLGV